MFHTCRRLNEITLIPSTKGVTMFHDNCSTKCWQGLYL
ncbi:MAG: hypothetical protein ACI9JZ_002589, partial [Lentimonas sp.]